MLSRRVVATLVVSFVVAACDDAPPQTTPVTPPESSVTSTRDVSPAPVPVPPASESTGVGNAAPTATDSLATNPMGTLSQDEASKSMPLAGHGNNHSSPSLEGGAKN